MAAWFGPQSGTLQVLPSPLGRMVGLPDASEDPAGTMAGFGSLCPLTWHGSDVGEPVGRMAGFDADASEDPAGTVAGFARDSCRCSRRYRATVSRLIPSSRAIFRCDQPLPLNVIIDCRRSILS